MKYLDFKFIQVHKSIFLFGKLKNKLPNVRSDMKKKKMRKILLTVFEALSLLHEHF